MRTPPWELDSRGFSGQKKCENSAHWKDTLSIHVYRRELPFVLVLPICHQWILGRLYILTELLGFLMNTLFCLFFIYFRGNLGQFTCRQWMFASRILTGKKFQPPLEMWPAVGFLVKLDTLRLGRKSPSFLLVSASGIRRSNLTEQEKMRWTQKLGLLGCFVETSGKHSSCFCAMERTKY